MIFVLPLKGKTHSDTRNRPSEIVPRSLSHIDPLENARDLSLVHLLVARYYIAVVGYSNRHGAFTTGDCSKDVSFRLARRAAPVHRGPGWPRGQEKDARHAATKRRSDEEKEGGGERGKTTTSVVDARARATRKSMSVILRRVALLSLGQNAHTYISAFATGRRSKYPDLAKKKPRCVAADSVCASCKFSPK